MDEKKTTGPRSFAPKRPRDTGLEGDGGDALSGRGDEGENTDLTQGPDASAPGDETSGTGSGSTGGTGAQAGGDAHLGHDRGKDGRPLGDPLDVQRQVPSDSSRDIANGSGAD